MGTKPTRLRFSEEDLSDKTVRRAADKAGKATDKAEKAVNKVRKKSKLKIVEDGAEPIKGSAPVGNAGKNASKKLRFDKAKVEADVVKPPTVKRGAVHGAAIAVSGTAHKQIAAHENDNVGIQAVHQSEEAVETSVHAVDHAIYSQKIKSYKKAERLTTKSDKANVNALFEKYKKDNPTASSNPVSRWKQKQAIKKQYAATKRTAEKTAQNTAKTAKSAAKTIEGITEKMAEFAATHSHMILIVAAVALLIMVISGSLSSCSMLMQGGGNVVLATSFTAKEGDIKGADDDFTALETDLRNRIDNIERTNPGYDEYRYDLAEIGHNPYELAALLTVQFEDYTRAEVQAEIQRIFNAQYTLRLEEEIEIRTRTETRTGSSTSTDPETGETSTDYYEYEVEVEYEYYILNVILTNTGINVVANSSGLDEGQKERYDLLLETRGNRDDLFGDVSFAVPGGEYTDYDIPGEALTDTKFANMIQEAEKYLGYPYVWGGASPSTSFDCSGFVSWVINHCGNGWSIGRQTANGLMGYCDIIRKSEAKPGDLIFFQGTYNTSGASHVGIYVGNNMMIHCGNPISYASIDTSYWQEHYYCMGRIR